MKRSRFLALVAVLGAALVAGTVFAQPPDPDGGQRGPGRRGGFGRDGGLPLRGLNLTDAQQQQIETLIQQHREQNREAALRLGQAFEAQRKAAEAVPFNEQAIRSTTQALVEAQTEVAVRQAKLRAEIHALLTPEQQAQAAKLRAEREARRPQRRDHERQGGPRQTGGPGR